MLIEHLLRARAWAEGRAVSTVSRSSEFVGKADVTNCRAVEEGFHRWAQESRARAKGICEDSEGGRVFVPNNF